jgi:hypothetical protein
MSLRKIRFQADCPWALCGWSVILLRTKQNGVQLGGSSERSVACPRTVCGAQADGLRGPGGRSAGSWQTVRPAQRPLLTTVDFTFLSLVCKRGQSVRASQTVREVRIFPITASNGKGEYK